MLHTQESTRPPLPILLVEDNPAHAELVVRGLEDQRVPAKIYHVSDGRAALQYLFREEPFTDPEVSPRPSIIILDLRLPKMGGLEVLQHIKESEDLHRIPVVILTTSDAGQDMKQAYDRQANSYVIKPTDFAMFMKLIEELCSYWLEWNCMPRERLGQ